VYPVAVGTNTTEGLQDIALDSTRQKVYVTNSGYNRIEVFDLQAMQFTAPIVVGQLPHSMAMGLDGTTLYVANTGGESISAVNLDTGVVSSAAAFPPLPRAGAQAPSHPVAMAMGQTGLQFLMATSNGTGTLASQWELINGNAVLRRADTIAVNPNNTSQSTLPGPMQMQATPDGANILTMNGLGTVYLFDGTNDAYTASSQLFNAPIQGYYGPVAAGPTGSYFLADGAVLSSTITQSTTTAGTRNIASVAAIDSNRFVRMTTPQRTAINVATRDDSRTLLELWDLSGAGSTLVGAVAENPYTEVFGTARVNLPPRQMAVDSNGTVYAITLSGLSVIPTTLASASTQPQLASSQAIVNANTGSTTVKPGDFITINGSNLASQATANQLPVPTILGGSCVLFNNVAIPLLQTSSGQIAAQIPATASAGMNVVQVKSLAMGQSSNAMTVTLAKP
jgi:DNA-binding beta-propeller fold protein YncE